MILYPLLVFGVILADQNPISPAVSGSFNVLNFGAKGDGKTNDTRSIQALETQSASGSAPVFSFHQVRHAIIRGCEPRDGTDVFLSVSGVPSAIASKPPRSQSQGWPLAVKAFPLNFADLPFAYAKLLDNEPKGLWHIHFAILGLHKGEKNLLAPIFQELLVVVIRCHARPSSAIDDSFVRERSYTGRVKIGNRSFSQPLARGWMVALESDSCLRIVLQKLPSGLG
jgi:hypothetical protein